MHETFQVKQQIDQFAYELELPDESGYRFCLVVHISRMKIVKKLSKHPRIRMINELDEQERFDFNEDLLTQDSWVTDEVNGLLEIEAIFNDNLPLSTSTDRT